MRVIDPSRQKSFHISEVTKTQLARQCNLQSQQLDALRQQNKTLGVVLIAVVLEPDSLKHADGKVMVDKTALEKVKPKMTLHFEDKDGQIRLHVTEPAVVETDEPRIVIPEGASVQ